MSSRAGRTGVATTTSGATDSGGGSGRTPATSAASILSRKEAPVVRKVRRGSADAALALQQEGVEALVKELLRDHVAFRSTPLIPLFPVALRSPVLIGALFRRGGYRSFPRSKYWRQLSEVVDRHCAENLSPRVCPKFIVVLNALPKLRFAEAVSVYYWSGQLASSVVTRPRYY